MIIEAKLEAYLSNLDGALSQVPISDRAEIITEIKSHVLEARAKNPKESLDDILQSLGDAENVAKRYLQERGLQANKPTKTSSMMWLPACIKWLVIGFLGFLTIAIIVAGIVIWQFTPLVSVDEQSHHVRLMGGVIDIHDTDKERKM